MGHSLFLAKLFPPKMFGVILKNQILVTSPEAFIGTLAELHSPRPISSSKLSKEFRPAQTPTL